MGDTAERGQLTLTPPALFRQIMLQSTKGGKQGEIAYRQFHVEQQTQPLKRKYTQVD